MTLKAMITDKKFYDKLVYLMDDYWQEVGDPRVNDWPLIRGGIWRILAIMIFYVVFTRFILPCYMKNRSVKMPPNRVIYIFETNRIFNT